MEKEQEIIRTSLRLPKKLYDRIAAIADEHGQTMHAEILHMLRDAVEMSEYQPGANAHIDVSDDGMARARELLEEVTRMIANAEALRKKNK